MRGEKKYRCIRLGSNMDDKTIITLCGIICLTILQIVNMFTMKIDSQITGLVIGTIGAIVGYAYGRHKKK